MTIFTIALYTGVAGLIWTLIENQLKKTDLVRAAFVKNWVAMFFIFSAVVKLVDPVGFSIKLNDYFDVFNLSFLKPTSLFLSFVLLVMEFSVAILLLFNISKTVAYSLLLAMMVFFTFLTGVSAIFNVVQDCGCFGDFLKVSPWTSFIKDIILLIMSIYASRNQSHFFSFFRNPSWAMLTASLGVFSSLAFALHNYYHLPIWDFRPYKIGTNIEQGMQEIKPAIYENKLVYKNKTTGEVKEFVDEFPEGDDWEFVSREQKLLDKGIPAPIHDFMLTSNEGEDLTEQVLSFEKPIVLFVIYDLSKVKDHGVNKMKALVEASNELDEYNYAFLTSSNDQQLEEWKQEHGFTGTNLSGDATMLKTMIRSNPGIILLRQGVILGKWNYRDTPSVEYLTDVIRFN